MLGIWKERTKNKFEKFICNWCFDSWLQNKSILTRTPTAGQRLKFTAKHAMYGRNILLRMLLLLGYANVSKLL